MIHSWKNDSQNPRHESESDCPFSNVVETCRMGVRIKDYLCQPSESESIRVLELIDLLNMVICLHGVILSAVSSYLRTSSITQCLVVCRQWHGELVQNPIVWSDLDCRHPFGP